ncbi:MAG: hypothetical protein IPP77_00545 [Bacteroidetes bacterium]|nr:hypothetical protein [Bacteroidota bacterium]
MGIDNYERDYYKVILNGKLEGTITPFGYLKLVLPPGDYTLQFVETGQFVKVPKTKNSTATVLQCATTDLPLTL